MTAQGSPAVVAALKDRTAATALLLATPEYNASVSGVLKNAVDWLSPAAARHPAGLRRQGGGLLGATPGPGGTRLAHTTWLPVLRALGTRLWAGKQLYVSGAG